ncbi:putative vesicle-associated membrane protein [Sesamum alatum]|uniref:Vesicle-associated membrane protein n=1 Tax=Sesamum alatum TaxID=300844 RepID=A0AAE1Y3Q3_9LAMI|nr:putative vesicle-associated membrane protein [Sesamum alatum]
MGQQSLIYSFVARGTVILAEYIEFTRNFIGIASQCLQKLPATKNKFTYNCDGTPSITSSRMDLHTVLWLLNLLEDSFQLHFLSELRMILLRNTVVERLLQLLPTA